MQAQTQIERIIRDYFGTGPESFLMPVSDESPAGEYLRFDSIYREINEARKADDASLPLGIWNHDLKKADWALVSKLTLNALTGKSKDIQLVIWLLEAEIHQQGFAAIAPILVLLAELCREFWPGIHPQIEDGDLESRLNPIAWLDDKLLPTLRLTPLTQRAGSGRDHCYADWLIARRNESLKKEDRRQLPKNSLSTEQLQRAMSDTPVDHYRLLREELLNALAGTEYLCEVLDELCDGRGLSLGAFSNLLAEILDLVEHELQRRGVDLGAAESGTEELDDLAGIESTQGDTGIAAMPGENGASRQVLYKRLEQIARYLMQSDPHSPAPYLIMQACKWGSMGTGELYEELFIKRQGQLHIFDLLGVSGKQPESSSGTSE